MLLDIMDNSNSVTDRKTTTNINGSVRRPTPVYPPHVAVQSGPARPASLLDSPNHPTGQYQIVRVTVNRDERGYGMKVSGDNPVYVQSVKPGGAAEKAGLHSGDKIMEVNGENVMLSTHTDVVSLIRSSSQVILTVQQRTGGHRMGSPSLHNRPLTTHSPATITGPQPVNDEKLYQLQLEREQHFRLMIEKEERYLEALRCQLARCPDEKKSLELEKAERNLRKLQCMLTNHVRNQSEQTPLLTYPVDNTDIPPPLPRTPPPNLLPPKTKKLKSFLSANDSVSLNTEVPPPLPKRNRTNSQNSGIIIDAQNNEQSAQYVNGKVHSKLFLCNELNTILRDKENNSRLGITDATDLRGRSYSLDRKKHKTDDSGVMVDNALYSDFSVPDTSSTPPPPLPPRTISYPNSPGSDPDAANSINKQMSYPLVATCATLVNNYSPNHTHHRTKSSPESLLLLSPAEASRRLIASESMSDLRSSRYDGTATPPGTPPPPYPSPVTSRKLPDSNRSSANTEEVDITCDETPVEYSSPDISPLRGSGPSPALVRVLANSSPIHAANPQTTQQSIMSMEDDEISDQEINQLEDHGPFRSLSRLWEHTPHLAVFMNYVLLNSDPNSLLFYLLTDLYKEGNVKEMKKWAYEIHSCFLVPGAPLHLSNVEENIAHEIDDVLTREHDKEEIMRKIFWKARIKAKEELTKQLSDFQQKRTAGLGTMYGPTDAVLAEVNLDKTRELKFYESLLLDKLEPYIEEVEKETYDPRKFYTAAALTTVTIRVFGVRSTGHVLDRFPTFVNKERSFRPKFIKYSRKFSVLGHTYVAQQYYTVISCYHCHQIIYGIGPQGYQCLVCGINLHRPCVKLYEDTCPGPITKKGIHKLMDFRASKDPRRKHSHSTQFDKKMPEDKDSGLDSTEGGDTKPGHPVTRSGSDRRPDALREEPSKAQDTHNHTPDNEDDVITTESSKSLPATTTNKRKSNSNINRSESVKEQTEKRKQRRNISDPLHNTSDSVDIDNNQALGYQANYGSTSNSSLSSGSSNDSPSSSVDNTFTIVAHSVGSSWDNENDYIEADPPDWQSSLSEEELVRLQPHEKKRQDVINELFHTERTHLRNLKVLERVFCKRIQEQKLLKDDEISLLFPNLSDLITIHSKFNTLMMSKKKDVILVREVGDILISMFDGPIGESFQKAAATFCEKQQHALDFIKEKRKKDNKFEMYLNEFEKDPACRRLPLQGFIPSEMQRLSKYPLLLERLIDIVEKNSGSEPEYSQTELSNLQQALSRSKEILNYVNEAAKQAWSKFRLQEIQKHLDTSVFEKMEHAIVNEFKNLDLTKYNLIYEGTVQLKRQSKQLLNVHMVLLEEVVILLQKEGERFLLKFFQSGIPGQQPLAPIIKMSTLLVRTNAALKCSLFLVNTSTQHSQMHELLTRDNTERKTWFKHLSDAAEAYNKREGKSKRSEPTPDEEETVVELPTTREATERAESVGGSESTTSEPEQNIPSSDSNQRSSSATEDDKDKRLSHSDSETSDTATVVGSTTGGGVSMKFAADDWPLIQPYEVQAAIPPVHSAAPVLTPIEQIRRKGNVVRQALEEKEKLVADLLSIPQEDYHHIADMAIEEAKNKELTEREPTALVLASVYQVDQLLLAVNQSLDISESDPVLMTGGKHPSCTSNETLISKNNVPSMPVHRIQEIATNLNSQLTTLLSVIKQRDEERGIFRKEIKRLREQLHEKSEIHCSLQYPEDDTTQVDLIQSGDLESIEESPTENESI